MMGAMMKAKILALLRERADYVSGQELCEIFGVSRTAVWKAIGQLKKEGYIIEAVQNRGYKLCAEEQDVYGADELASRINTEWVGKPAFFYESIGSTNAQAKIDAENGASGGTLIVADRQTAGRGRRGRSWDSPAGINIYYTLILKPDFAPDKASMLTIVMAMAVAEGIQRTLSIKGETEDAQVGIKWPNDIVINGKKVCGILTEMSIEKDYIQNVVIGVGINVREQEFAPEIADKATSLEAECGKKISRCALIGYIMEAFENDYAQFCANENLSQLLDRYNSMLVNMDREVCVLDPKGEYNGTARGINEEGELIVETADGNIKQVYAGEVSVRGIYGYV
jgi:BirA family biotin operon repressor/biotin-[acetyl-CoA-carboxylase] ligase